MNRSFEALTGKTSFKFLFGDRSVDLNFFKSSDGDVSSGVELSGLLGVNVTSGSLDFVLLKLNREELTNCCTSP
jgi:hypothetical protein